jgi:hypothetical protein
MTNKEIAARLRSVAKLESSGSITKSRLHEIADELDPQGPEPGTVVWWRIDRNQEYHLGLISIERDSVVDIDGRAFFLRDTEWKPARILAPDEVAVKVPPVEEWPDMADSITWVYREPDGALTHYDPIITRAEAEAREVEAANE